MTLVRTKKQPDLVLDVDDAELLDLTRMGLILEVVPAVPATPPAPAATSTPSVPAPVKK